MSRKLAVLMPVFNGGALLEESVRSCGNSGLDPRRYEILVVDNCSTDGAVDRLAAAKLTAAPVRIFRNTSNLGRIGNWNRAVEIAENEGFVWATFLFVGDAWTPGGSLPRILSLMEDNLADFALAAYQIFDLRSDRWYLSPRVSIPGGEMLIGSRALLSKLLLKGEAPVCPLQCNVYALKQRGLLRFAERDPVSADSMATIRFLHKMNGRTVVVADPFMAWCLHPGRFYASRDILEFQSGDLRLLREAQSIVGSRVDWGRAKAHVLVSVLQSAVRFELWYRWPVLFFRCVRMLRSMPGTFSPLWACRIVFRKLLFNESPLHIDA